ncbi:MAG: ParB-like protein [Prochlorococcaceae cyanobacterium]|jgi:hypothetical protein
MTLQLPPYDPLPPPPDDERQLLKVPVAALRPTQLCVGLAEVRQRHHDFADDSADERRRYLRRKPVPLVRAADGLLWMVDRHHRLRALLDLDPDASAWGYPVLEVPAGGPEVVLPLLARRGWLYLHDGRGRGPLAPTSLPAGLGQLQDDPYRSLVWKLKQEGVIAAAPLIPFHEFRWGAWLRRRSLPPFQSHCLEPALPAARTYARSTAASVLAGWRGSPSG